MSDAPSLSVSVVIPVLNAAPYLPTLIPALQEQSVAPTEIILVDSGSTDETRDIAAGFTAVRVVNLDRFTHGRSRNRGVQEATGEVIVLVTQDAVPQDNTWLATLVAPLGNDGVVAACSRQIPNDDASPMERFFLQKRFPQKGEVRNLETLEGDASYERVLFSDVSCAALREVMLNIPTTKR